MKFKNIYYHFNKCVTLEKANPFVAKNKNRSEGDRPLSDTFGMNSNILATCFFAIWKKNTPNPEREKKLGEREMKIHTEIQQWHYRAWLGY